MPANCTRQRIDWVPGDAGLQALEIAEGLFPGLSRQDVIDRLVITGLSALKAQWIPPVLNGRSRHKWKLPSDLVPVCIPGNRPANAAANGSFPGMAGATANGLSQWDDEE